MQVALQQYFHHYFIILHCEYSILMAFILIQLIALLMYFHQDLFQQYYVILFIFHISIILELQHIPILNNILLYDLHNPKDIYHVPNILVEFFPFQQNAWQQLNHHYLIMQQHVSNFHMYLFLNLLISQQLFNHHNLIIQVHLNLFLKVFHLIKLLTQHYYFHLHQVLILQPLYAKILEDLISFKLIYFQLFLLFYQLNLLYVTNFYLVYIYSLLNTLQLYFLHYLINHLYVSNHYHPNLLQHLFLIMPISLLQFILYYFINYFCVSILF